MPGRDRLDWLSETGPAAPAERRIAIARGMMVSVNVTVVDVPEKDRFEARDDSGAMVGMVTYQLSGNIIVYTHTEVLPEFEGQGIAGRLAAAVMDDARDRGRTVVPLCPYISKWLEKHPEYDDVVARTTRKVK
jgi:predicted GNAT family acetyltransferase